MVATRQIIKIGCILSGNSLSGNNRQVKILQSFDMQTAYLFT